MRKLISIAGMISMLSVCTIPVTEQPAIVETVITEPNVVILAKNEVRETKHWDEECSDNTIEISYPDAQLIMMLMSAEGLNQGVVGMVRIGNVLLNRVRSPLFPNTIQDVIFQPGQFECVTNGTFYNAEITPEVRQALAEIEMNKNNDTEIIAFETTVNGRVLQKYFTYLYTIGDHDFYIMKKD